MKEKLEVIAGAITNGCGKQAIIREINEFAVLGIVTTRRGYKKARVETLRLIRNDIHVPKETTIGDIKSLNIKEITHLVNGGHVRMYYNYLNKITNIEHI